MSSPGPLLKTASLLFLVTIWGTTWAAVTISLRGFPPFTGVTLRFAVAAAILAVFARVTGQPLRAVDAVDRRLRVAHAVLTFSVSYGVVFWAQQWVPSGMASVLFATFPLMVAAMAHFVLPGEQMTLPVFAGIVVGFSGIAVIFGGDFDRLGGREIPLAACVMLAAPLAGATASVAIKKWGRHTRPIPFNATAVFYGSLIMFVVAMVSERDQSLHLERWPILAVLYMAVAGTALTFPLYFWLLKHMQARKLALIGYGTPVVALFLGFVVLDEPLTTRALVGSALVVLGVAVASRGSER